MTDLEDDVRLIQRNLAKGFLAVDVVDAKLAKLPDVADRGEWVDIYDQEEDEDEGDADAAPGAGDAAAVQDV